MTRWFRDTLFLRLFVLMWAALVISHIAAFGIVTQSFWNPGSRPDGQMVYPTFPSLPPTPGMPGDPLHDREAQRVGPVGFQQPFLPTTLLLLDYAIRLVVIGAAAAIGARWLARPVQRLVDAAGSLGPSVRDDSPLPSLDEHVGTVEVRDAARVFNRMARELHAQFRARSLLMASLSHDLKTPLTRMRMRLENSSDAAVVQRCIGDIREMNGLLDTALDVFRNASADEPTETVDVGALLQSIVDDLAEQGSAATLREPAAPALARARPVALRRIVANLVGNAIRYGGGVEIGIDVDGRMLCVLFDDRGPGIAPEHLESVFEPFFRVEPSRNRASGGTGLGLYIARDLARRQGGELLLSNRPGGGLRAELQLPAAG